MGSLYLSPYEDPEAHARISALIRGHSSNDRDVRADLLRSLDLGGAEDLLDLGCGFGFWAEELAARVAPDARFTGVDACDGNEASYVRCVQSHGRRARFVRAHLVSHLPFDDDSFDLVIAAYSLYFFVGVIPEVARVLRPEGSFLAVTHSEKSFTGLLSAIGLADEECPLLRQLREFSSERGESLLAGTFRRVERTNYLTFEERDLEDLLGYLAFKLPLVRPGARYGAELPDAFIRAASTAMQRKGRLTVEKDDTLFVCGGAHGR
jgi:ubiquinone/menaquinone biosynthesis C-methylase UbiE